MKRYDKGRKISETVKKYFAGKHRNLACIKTFYSFGEYFGYNKKTLCDRPVNLLFYFPFLRYHYEV